MNLKSHILQNTSGRFCFVAACPSKACWCKAYSLLSHKLTSEQEQTRWASWNYLWSLLDTTCHLPSCHFWQKATEVNTASLSLTHTAKTAAPSLTLFPMPFEIVFPLPSRNAVWQFSISSLFRPFNIGFVLFSCRHRSPRLRNRMAFPLPRFIFYRQEWQRHSQCAIIEITVWLGSQDTLLVDENLIAGFKCSLEFRIKYTCCWNATQWEAA